MEEAKRLKIAVLCASRNNHGNLRTVIGTLDMLKSGAHDIFYIVGCDDDDRQTQDAVSRLCHDKIFTLGCHTKRMPALGSVWNYLAASTEADVYALVTDRALCVTPLWDHYIADSCNKDAARVVWWTTNAGPVIPIVPKAWLKAAGNIYTDYFPFWFDDTWLHELSAMVHGLPNFMVQASCFIGKRSPVTKRMRDLRFWMDFFIHKREERRLHAKAIREKLGVKEPDMKPVEEWFRSNDEMWDKTYKQWEEVMRDPSAVDDSYLIAKKAAEDAMNDNVS